MLNRREVEHRKEGRNKYEVRGIRHKKEKRRGSRGETH
jgi:hypothetical protein